MYILEPKKTDEGWQMVCRSMGPGKEVLPVGSLHPTSDAARIDPISAAWGKLIAGIGELGMTQLRDALAKAEADGETLGLPAKPGAK